MKLSRIIPTVVLVAGAAGAQPMPAPAPAAPPAPPAYAQSPMPAPRPARPPRPMLAQDAHPLPPKPPAPAMAPLAPLPPMDYVDVPMPAMAFDQDKLIELQEKAWEMQEKFKFDVDHQFELDHKLAAVTDSFSNLKFNMPFAFAPQQAMRGRTDSDRAYESGQRALEGRRYTEALEYFNVASRGGSRADGALYWKAYSLIKLGRADEARAAIAELRKTHAQSRWLDDAKALEVEAGKPVSPESESDEELKMLALNGLMQSDPDRALPLLENVLKSAQPPRIRRQAIIVLAQSSQPKAQQVLEQVARGQGNPDLQLSAIRYLGERRRQGGSNPVLAEIYGSSQDQNVKRAVLTAYENSRDKDRLLAIAKSEQDRDLRLHAIRLLGSIQGTQADLWALFQAESTPEGKQMILESIPSAGNLDKMLEVARTEKEPKVRRYAINQLSTTRAATTGDALVQIYTNEQDQEVKRAIVSALASQKNVKQLISAARTEKDLRMRQRILEHLVSMKSPEASEYLMEIINK